MIRVFGQITDASGKGVPGAMIELRALKSTAEVLYGSVLPYKCDALGNYDFPLAIGAYDAYAQNDACGDMDYLGSAVVAANTTDGDLHHILVDGGINITPPMLESAMEYTRRAEQAAIAAETDREQTAADAAATTQNRQVSETKAREAAASAGEAKTARDSIVDDAADVRAKAKQVADNATLVANNTTAVQRNADQVVQNTQTVSTKALQVIENAQSVAENTLSVTQMRDEVAAKTSMAQGAADTATQKAASAAESDASARDAATRAENAALAMTGAILDGGQCDLSSGFYPQPLTVNGKKYSTVWYVKVGGVVGGIAYDAGDVLRYTTAENSYFKIDAVDTATAQINAHAAKAGAHPISGVAGLAEALADKASAQEVDLAIARYSSDFGFGSTCPPLATGESLSSDVATSATRVFTLSGSYGEMPTGYTAITGQLFVMRRKFDAGAACVMHMYTHDRKMFMRIGTKSSGVWNWGSGWSQVYDTSNPPSAADAGADPAGTAAALVDQHAKKADAHQISAISGLADALAGKLSISSGPIAFRNLVNNGGMQISQRGSLFPNVGNGDYTLDRWRLAKNSGAIVSVQRRTDDRPSGIGVAASLELKVKTADTSISSSEYVCIQQPMEGVNILPIYGNTFVISFWVKSSLSGKYSVSLLTDSPAYSFVAEYTINAANTWERKSIVVAGGFPLSYELQLGSVTGMRLTFAVACGSSLQATQGAWRSGGFFGVADQVNLLGKVDATFSLTAVQLELGGIPTPFEHKPFPLELSICQRYCLQVNSIDVASETIGIGGYCTGTSAISQYHTPVEMRDTPSWVGGVLSIVTTAGVTPVDVINKRGASIVLSAQNTAPYGQSCYVASSGMNAGFRGFIAEL